MAEEKTVVVEPAPPVRRRRHETSAADIVGAEETKEKEEKEPSVREQFMAGDDPDDVDEDTELEDTPEEKTADSDDTQAILDAAIAEKVENEMYNDPDGLPEPTGEEDEKAVEKVVKDESEHALNQAAKAQKVEVSEEEMGFRNIKGVHSATRQEKRRIYSNGDIIPLEDSLGFKTEADKRHEEYIALVNSQRGHNLLSGRVTATSTKLGRICAVIRYGLFSVTIPFELFVTDEQLRQISEEPNEADKEHMRRRFVNTRIGSTVDFVVRGVDEVNMVAVGDRREAMALKRQAWYMTRNGRNGFQIDAGTIVEARVVAATPHSVTIEAYGVEKTLREVDIAYVRIPNVAEEFPVGSTVPFKFTKVERTTNGNHVGLRIEGSIKEAMPDPRQREFETYSEGDLVTATVTYVDDTGIFARIGGMEGKQDIVLRFPQKSRRETQSPELPKPGYNVLCKILTKQEYDREGRPVYHIYGTIVRMLSRNAIS